MFDIIMPCVSKTMPFIFLNNFGKNQPILINFGIQHPEETWHWKISDVPIDHLRNIQKCKKRFLNKQKNAVLYRREIGWVLRTALCGYATYAWAANDVAAFVKSFILFYHHLHSPSSSAYIFLLFIQWHQIRCLPSNIDRKRSNSLYLSKDMALYCNSAGGSTTSFILLFYCYYLLFIIYLHYKTYFWAVSICDI